MEGKRKHQNDGESRAAYDKGQHNLGQCLEAQRGKELRAGAIADGEDKESEEDRLEQCRDDDGP